MGDTDKLRMLYGNDIRHYKEEMYFVKLDNKTILIDNKNNKVIDIGKAAIEEYVVDVCILYCNSAFYAIHIPTENIIKIGNAYFGSEYIFKGTKESEIIYANEDLSMYASIIVNNPMCGVRYDETVNLARVYRFDDSKANENEILLARKGNNIRMFSLAKRGHTEIPMKNNKLKWRDIQH